MGPLLISVQHPLWSPSVLSFPLEGLVILPFSFSFPWSIMLFFPLFSPFLLDGLPGSRCAKFLLSDPWAPLVPKIGHLFYRDFHFFPFPFSLEFSVPYLGCLLALYLPISQQFSSCFFQACAPSNGSFSTTLQAQPVLRSQWSRPPVFSFGEKQFHSLFRFAFPKGFNFTLRQLSFFLVFLGLFPSPVSFFCKKPFGPLPPPFVLRCFYPLEEATFSDSFFHVFLGLCSIHFPLCALDFFFPFVFE